MHFGHGINAIDAVVTKPTSPPTPLESCAYLKKASIRSKDGQELEAFLEQVAQIKPNI